MSCAIVSNHESNPSRWISNLPEIPLGHIGYMKQPYKVICFAVLQLFCFQVDYPPFEVACLVIATLGAYCLLVALYFSRKLKKCFQHELNAMFGHSCEMNRRDNPENEYCKED